jgi:spore germination protein YaaH
MVDNQVIGQKDDGARYLEFLRMLKPKLGEKSVSIAAPASYWYLKAFPIEEISKAIDYIVCMTYDLHGQWDYGNPNAFDSCASGKCIRSHGLCAIRTCKHHVLTEFASESHRDNQCTCDEYVLTWKRSGNYRANF